MTLKKRLKKLDKSNYSLSIQLDDLITQKDKMSKTLEETLSRTFDNSKSSLEILNVSLHQHDLAKYRSAELDSKIETLQGEKEEWSKAKAVWESEVSRLTSSEEALKKELVAEMATTNQYRDDNTKLAAEIERCLQAVQELEKQNATLILENERVTGISNELRSLLTNALEADQSKRIELEQMKTKLVLTEQKNLELEHRKRTFEKQTSAEMEKESSMFHEEHLRYLQVMDDLKKQLDSSAEQVSTLR